MSRDPFETLYSLKEIIESLDIGKAIGLYRIIDPDGRVVADREPDLPRDLLVNMYALMVRTRIFDKRLLELWKMGKIVTHVPSIGEEAVAIGSALALEERDWVFPYYRNIGVFIARGVPEEEIIDRDMANIDDPSKGKGRQLFAFKKHRIGPTAVLVGNHIPYAVGFALGAKIAGENIAVMAIFGEGATSRGAFHVGLNFAGLYRLPIVFIVENNQWAISTPAWKQTASPTFAIKGIAYNVPGVRVDGNDVVAMYTAARAAVERAKRGGGPTLIEAVTYRIGPPSTSHIHDDPGVYRSHEEIRRMERYDPISRFRKYLIDRGYISEKEDKEIYDEWGKRIESAIKRCLSKPQPPEEAIFDDIYSKRPWDLEEEVLELRESLRIARELGIRVG